MTTPEFIASLSAEQNAALLVFRDELTAAHVTSMEEFRDAKAGEIADKTAEIERLTSALADKDAAHAAELERLQTEHAEVLTAAQGQPRPTGGVSKLTIMRRLGDKWPTLKGILSQLPELVQDAWLLAQEIRSDDPLFADNAEFLKSALNLTDEEFTALLTP